MPTTTQLDILQVKEIIRGVQSGDPASLVHGSAKEESMGVGEVCALQLGGYGYFVEALAKAEGGEQLFEQFVRADAVDEGVARRIISIVDQYCGRTVH